MTLKFDIKGISPSSSSGTPSGTISITKNGIVDISNYAKANVNVDGGSALENYIPLEVSSTGILQYPSKNFTWKLSKATDLSEKVLHNTFNSIESLTSVDLSSLISISGSQSLGFAFNGCSGLTSLYLNNLKTASGDNAMQCFCQNCTNLKIANLSSLETISGSNEMYYAFNGCSSLTSLYLDNLKTISGSYAMYGAFQDCYSLTSVNLSNLLEISGSCSAEIIFNFCTNLTSVNLSSLNIISGNLSMRGAFQNCTSLTELRFPALTTESFGDNSNQFYNMLSGVTGCTVHFPASIKDTIGGWSSVTNGFGGTNTVVLFDL